MRRGKTYTRALLVGSWAAPVDRSTLEPSPVEASEEPVDPAAGPVGPGGRCLVDPVAVHMSVNQSSSAKDMQNHVEWCGIMWNHVELRGIMWSHVESSVYTCWTMK